ncbi:MAG: flagellar basal body L-ring protein FlgH, partial [Pseudomonadales bacterium]|nr:flagellar basal body L-ring protein FlgH [Pseudomonadales bacterium]
AAYEALARDNRKKYQGKIIGITGSVGKTSKTEVGSLDLGMQRGSGGFTRREGELRAQVSATLVEQDERGYFLVKGNQNITINGEEQIIALEGWLRPHDVDQNNVVLSTRLADAKIEYQGFGDKSDTEKPGFVSWLLNKVGLI